MSKSSMNIKRNLIESIGMLTKDKLIEQIDKFPEEFSIDELVEKLILIEKIETGDNQSKNGEIISESKMENKIEKWFE